ncbi:alpha-1,2-fucosyltransferase [Aquiluna sp.]|nr:alpha-1,2-fucosyltransferase [Aquiluna sp.]
MKVVSRLSGGLGNQLFQFSAALWLARGDLTSVYVDPAALRFNAERGKATIRDFELKVPLANKLQVISYNHEVSVPVRMAAMEGRSQIGTLAAAVAPVFSLGSWKILRERGPAFEALSRASSYQSIFLSGYWQDYRIAEALGSQIRNILTPRPELSTRLLDLKGEINSGTSVAVHVRRGDFQTASASLHDVTNASYFERGLRHLQEELGALRVFVFSDDISWCQDNLAFPSRTRYVAAERGDTDFAHLWLMSQADNFVISNSTFSWWAAWLGMSKTKRVVRPPKWLRREPKHLQVYHPSWQVLRT